MYIIKKYVIPFLISTICLIVVWGISRPIVNQLDVSKTVQGFLIVIPGVLVFGWVFNWLSNPVKSKHNQSSC